MSFYGFAKLMLKTQAPNPPRSTIMDERVRESHKERLHSKSEVQITFQRKEQYLIPKVTAPYVAFIFRHVDALPDPKGVFTVRPKMVLYSWISKYRAMR